ncbi:hypothetical protein EOM81_03790 [bacterium]|nr:hypothetical protein [bacterium]
MRIFCTNQEVRQDFLSSIPNFPSKNRPDLRLEHDRSGYSSQIERNLDLDSFPSPQELWEKYKRFKGIKSKEQEDISSFDYFFDGSGRKPRYYQQIAVNRTVEAGGFTREFNKLGD